MLRNIEIEDNIGKDFVVKDILGGEWKTGMGTVYLCLNNEYKFIMALKTFQDQFIYSEEIKKRFKNEALAWIHLGKHPNIVTAYSFDIFDDRPFILLEPIVPDDKGRNTLEHYIETDIAESQLIEMVLQDLFPEFKRGKKITYINPLFLEVQVLDWSIQFCHGMEYAKSKGVTPHRDIKPANIMITRDNVLKITDFGLAKIWDKVDDLSKFEDIPEEIINFLHTDATKMYSGTPEYMAPEQFDGHADFRSDIYSFGVILYQMINRGIPPFEDEISLGWEEAHKKGKIKIIESDIFPIVEKCLEKKPEDRYQNFEELRHDLETLYKKKTNNDPPKPPKEIELEAWEYVNKAYALKKLGYTNLSILNLRKAININPDLYQAHMNLGIEFIECEQYENAIQEFKEVIKINPNYAKAHYNLANNLSKINELNDVIYHYKEAIRLDPKCKQAHVNMGKTLSDMGQIDKAIYEYKKALSIDHDFFPAIMNLGQALEAKGMHKEAINQYERAYEIEPEDPGLYNSWGIALSNIGNETEAINKYIRAITLKPEYSEAHNNLGISFTTQGKSDLAIHEFNESIKCNPNNSGTYNSLGIVLAQSEEYDNAISKFERSLEIDSKNISVQENLIMARLQYGSVLLAQEKYMDAVEQYKQIINMEPDNASAHDDLGVAFFHLDQIDDAIHEFEEVLRIDPKNENARNNLKISQEYKDGFSNTA